MSARIIAETCHPLGTQMLYVHIHCDALMAALCCTGTGVPARTEFRGGVQPAPTPGLAPARFKKSDRSGPLEWGMPRALQRNAGPFTPRSCFVLIHPIEMSRSASGTALLGSSTGQLGSCGPCSRSRVPWFRAGQPRPPRLGLSSCRARDDLRLAILCRSTASGASSGGQAKDAPPRKGFLKSLVQPLRDFGLGKSSMIQGTVGLFVLSGVGARNDWGRRADFCGEGLGTPGGCREGHQVMAPDAPGSLPCPSSMPCLSVHQVLHLCLFPGHGEACSAGEARDTRCGRG